MKIYSIFLSLLTLAIVTACQSDDLADTPVADDGADVSLTVAVRDVSTSGIATRAFADANAVAGEMMKNYVIVAVDQSTGKITHILQSGDLGTEAESSSYKVNVHFDSGTYTFYTFANLTLDQLGLSSAKVGDAAPDFDSKTLAVNGNQTAVTAFTSGIPMSNKQTVVINAHTPSVKLYVMRMVAKMTLKLTNATNATMTLNSITLSDITKNASEVTASDGITPVPNLYLLPTTATDSNGKDYCTPRLTTAFSSTADASSYSGYSSYSLYSDYTITPATALSIPANNSATPAEVTFYVNESAAHDPANFQLTLNLTTTQTDGKTENTASRYTILNWQQIGRNDYRVIPITIDDYKLTFDVKYFTAIGVLPPTVTDDGQILDLGFSYYGEIHLVPKIKRWSDDTDVTKTVNPQYDGATCWNRFPADDNNTNPSGFFAKAPYWNSTKNCVDASLGFTKGTSAVYRLQCTIDKGGGTKETLSRNVRFTMTPMSLSKPMTPLSQMMLLTP